MGSGLSGMSTKGSSLSESLLGVYFFKERILPPTSVLLELEDLAHRQREHPQRPKEEFWRKRDQRSAELQQPADNSSAFVRAASVVRLKGLREAVRKKHAQGFPNNMT